MRIFLCFTVLLALTSFVAGAGGRAPDDDDIYDQVNRKLNGDVDIHGRIKLEVKNGVVTITGRVASDKIRSKAEKITKKVNGVKEVVNKLEIGDDKPPR